jgi:predicted PurR-regulated permease PerM
MASFLAPWLTRIFMDNGAIVRTSGLLVSLAAFVVVVAGMKAAAPLLVPFLLALFISVIIASPYSWLQARGLPAILALMVVLGLFVGAVFLMGALIGNSVEDFSRTFPEYQMRLKENTDSLVAWLNNKGIHISGELLSSYMDPAKAMKMVANILSGMGGLLTNGFLILITVIFLMLEAASFPGKWRAARSNAEDSLGRFNAAIHNINQYMGIKTLTSLATGIVIAVWLTILGVDYAMLWGLLAFLLNFVPNIGSILAAVPAVLLALVQLGPAAALLTGIGFLVANVTIGTFLEPRFMGKGLGLSTLVVFLSLVFWGWILGPVGMLLSVPLTIAIKIALDSHSDTRWMAVMLGPGIVPESLPAEEAQVPETGS